MKKNKVLYIGNFSFPDVNASGKRVYGNGKAMRELGYEVIYLGMSNDIDNKAKIKNTHNNYDGFDYYNLSYPKSTKEWINYKSTFKKVIKFLEKEKITDNLTTVIYYGNPRLSLFNYHLIKWCKKNNIKIISDCVDWLSVKTGNIIFDFIKWADTTYQKAYLNTKVDGVIVISSFLSDFYEKRGLKTVIIPPLSANDVLNINLEKNKGVIKLMYAGLPFRKKIVIKDPNTLKDRIDKTIILLSEVKKNGGKFIFNIFGFTKEEYLSVLPSQKEYIEILGNSIKFQGHKSNKMVLKELKISDFTILLRDKKRDTMAGFPTKVSESISYGIPVITTDTSDLKLYLKNGKTSYFIDDKITRENIETVIKILKSNKLELNKNIFYYKKYSEKLNIFLSEI